MVVLGKLDVMRKGKMLTNKQRQVIEKFWKRGWFWAWEISGIFSSRPAKDACVNKLLILGIIKEESFKFHINREKFLEYQREHEDKKLGDY